MIYVDKIKCIGCGLCSSICPAVFGVGGEGVAEVLDENSKEPCANEAKESCPTMAINIT